MEKTNYLLNKIQRLPEINDKMYLYAEDLEEPKHKFLLIKGHKVE